MQLNSKECLESIKNTKTNHIKNGKLGQPIKMYLVKELKKEEIETIKQDLDKLESLERFKTRLLQDTNKLYNENQKLKKVIDILKKKRVEISFLLCSKDLEEYEDYCGILDVYFPTISNYEFLLLKEVLGNEV